jgi:phosphoribosylamine---glycine ligase
VGIAIGSRIAVARSLSSPASSISRRGGNRVWRGFHLRVQMRGHRSSRILVAGKDARTDAIAVALAASPLTAELYALSELENPPGLLRLCKEVRRGSLTDLDWMESATREISPALVVVGPEEPLAAGYVDRLEALGIPAFGPPSQLAAIESSKAWARELLEKYEIPGNPAHRAFEGSESLRDYMEELGDFVVKPDGLTAGKGVKVFGEHLHSIDEALAYATDVLEDHPRVQIEERLEGEEFSLQTITDGDTVIHCPLVQDHKRAYPGDQGPNTGGMGSYSCADFSLPFLGDADVLQAHTISEKVIAALASETGKPYKGVLYGGFIATADGVRLIEYNARFGDPEAMNVLPILDADFAEICFAVAEGELGKADWSFQPQATVCKYVVPEAYPQKSDPTELGITPTELDRFGAVWYWAACEQREEGIFMTSSRTGAFVGSGNSLHKAEAAAEQAAQELQRGRPIRYRADIGTEPLIRKRIDHMQKLRGPQFRPHASY